MKDKNEKEMNQKVRRKPGRIPTACAECRRLKLRCDKKVPCEKCVSRGCESICPDGSLTAGKGHRLILSGTRELHERIDQLCSRIRDLEEALAVLQSMVSEGPHPLLRNDLLQLKLLHNNPNTNAQANPPAPQISGPTGFRVEGQGNSSSFMSSSAPPPAASGMSFNGINVVNNMHCDKAGDNAKDENYIDAFGTLSIGANGETSFLGKTARSEYLIRALSKPTPHPPTDCPRLPKKIIQSTCASEDQELDDSLGQEIFGLLPCLSEAIRLCEIYLDAGKYMYASLPRKELLDEIFASVYRAGSFSSLPSKHSLSLLFIVFALGALFDPNRPPYSIDAQEYYYLARAARNHTSMSGPICAADDDEEEEGSISGGLSISGGKRTGGGGMSIMGLWTTIHMSQYLEFSDWEALGSSSAWWFVGFSSRLATSLGLHLNSARWNVPEETQKKRALVFWQIFSVDTWLSFHYGRPPSLSRVFIDCPLPEDTEEYVTEDGKKEIGFHSWTFQYTFFMHSVIEKVFGCNSPPYSVIIDFDRQIRDFPVPSHLRPRCKMETVDEMMAKGGNERVKTLQTLTMQRLIVISYKESTLLNLHRAYFAQALQDSPDDLARHKYLPSVMATYRSAWRLIRGLEFMWGVIPQLLDRYNLAWSQALSAAIVMCILVTRAPHSKMTGSSLAELDTVVKLFEDASKTCRSAANILDTVRNLRHKAREAVDQRQHLSQLASSKLSADELDRLGGRTHLISSSKRSRRESKHNDSSSYSNSNSASPITTSNYGSPISHTVSSPVAGPSTPPSHTSSSSPTASQPSIPPLRANISSDPDHNQTENPLQALFSNQSMHPIIVHDMQDIFKDFTVPAMPGPFPLFYDLPTGLPGLEVGPPSLPQYMPGPSSIPGSHQVGANADTVSPMSVRLLDARSGESSPVESDFPSSGRNMTDLDHEMDFSPPRIGWNPGSPTEWPSFGVPTFLENPQSLGGGYGSVISGSGPTPPILDATWQSFVEQLGF